MRKSKHMTEFVVNDVTIPYITTTLPLSDFYIEPRSPDEILEFLDMSSNWMKLYKQLPDLSTTDLRRLATVELRGRAREHILERVIATAVSRIRDSAHESFKRARPDAKEGE